MLRVQNCTQRHDVFFWLCLHGNETLARAVWADLDLPIHMMLLAAMLTEKMSKVVIRGSAEAAERVARFQEWARGAMEMADEERAHMVLEATVCEKWTAIDIAMHTGAKRFLSQRHCASLTDLWWRGGTTSSCIMLPPNYSRLILLVQVFLPFLHPDIRQGRRVKHGAADKTFIGKGHVFEAIARFMKTARVELEESKDGLYSAGLARAEHDSGRASPLARRRSSAQLTGSMKGLESVVGMQEGEADAVALMSPLVSFYAIPAVRFLQRALLHVIRTLFYVLIIFRDFKTQKDLNNAYADTSIPWSEKLPQVAIPCGRSPNPSPSPN